MLLSCLATQPGVFSWSLSALPSILCVCAALTMWTSSGQVPAVLCSLASHICLLLYWALSVRCSAALEHAARVCMSNGRKRCREDWQANHPANHVVSSRLMIKLVDNLLVQVTAFCHCSQLQPGLQGPCLLLRSALRTQASAAVGPRQGGGVGVVAMRTRWSRSL